MSTRLAGPSRPIPQNTTSAKVRWMSMPMMRRMSAPSIMVDDSDAPHDIYGSALAAQPGKSQGRPETDTSSRLIVRNGLPTFTKSPNRRDHLSVPSIHTFA